VAGGLNAVVTSQPIFETTPGPGGEIAEKVTTAGFRQEAENSAGELVNEAENYFNAAEQEFEASQYQDAVRNYQKSIDVLPTMSGYLNLGISLSNISDFSQAQYAFISGLLIAKERERERI
jgi:tetratricopeptide (TPR) repeat protein